MIFIKVIEVIPWLNGLIDICSMRRVFLLFSTFVIRGARAFIVAPLSSMNILIFLLILVLLISVRVSFSPIAGALILVVAAVGPHAPVGGLTLRPRGTPANSHGIVFITAALGPVGNLAL
eukprot:TRINITY_DN522_c0_g1_i11.p2 TRINITY_DN522_c0_g1~~TRINITY_DN522_c0_g1_i11.p2  ORF type:complete len:120 (+),score=11.57 TRINITY_DN522_c0_g1_i11:541-900(+)